MSRSRSGDLLAVLMACTAIGCARPTEDGATSGVSLQVVDRGAYDALIAQYHGQVVLVDFWATWCAPCLKQLPHTLELAERRQGDGLAVMTVSMDEPDSRPRAEKALAERTAGSAATHLVSANGGGSRAMDDFEIASGALPHYKLYDRTGKLRRTFDLDPLAEKPFTTDDIDAAVADLLAEKAH